MAGEITLTHGTAHARLAVHEMVRGRWRAWFWASLALTAAGMGLAFRGAAGLSGAAALSGAATLLALLGLAAFEHAYVQAGQSVPLA